MVGGVDSDGLGVEGDGSGEVPGLEQLVSTTFDLVGAFFRW